MTKVNAFKMKQIHTEFHQKLKQFIARKVSNFDDVEDLLQEVYIRIYQHLDKVNQSEKYSQYIYKICRHVIADYYRNKKKMTSLDDDWLIEENPDPSAIELLASVIKLYIEKLPEPYRQTLIESELIGLRQNEIARVETISHSAIKSRVQRGRAKLKQLLYDCCNYEFDSRNELCCYSKKETCCESPKDPEITAYKFLK